MATRLTGLQIGGAAIALGALGSGVYSGVDTLLRDKTVVETVYVTQVQTGLTGTGAKTATGSGLNNVTLYDYKLFSGYQPLVQTGGQLTDIYALGRFVWPHSYTGSLVGDLCIDVATAPTSNATFVDVNVRSVDSTASGRNIFNNVALTAGAKCKNFNGTGSLVGPDQEVVLLSTFGSGAGLVADWVFEYRETELN